MTQYFPGQCGWNTGVLQKQLKRMRTETRLVYGTLWCIPAGRPLYPDKGVIGKTVPGHFWLETKDGRVADVLFTNMLTRQGSEGRAVLQKFPDLTRHNGRFRVLTRDKWAEKFGVSHLPSSKKRQKKAFASRDRHFKM